MKRRVLAFVLTLLVIVSNFSGVRFVEAKDGNTFVQRDLAVEYVSRNDSSVKVKYVLDYDQDSGHITISGSRLFYYWSSDMFHPITEIQCSLNNIVDWSADNKYGASVDTIHDFETKIFGKAITENGNIDIEGVSFNSDAEYEVCANKIFTALGVLKNGNDVYFRLTKWDYSYDNGAGYSFKKAMWYKKGSSDFQNNTVLYGDNSEKYEYGFDSHLWFDKEIYAIVDDEQKPVIVFVKNENYNDKTGVGMEIVNMTESPVYFDATYRDSSMDKNVSLKIPFSRNIPVASYFVKEYKDGVFKKNPVFDKSIYVKESQKDPNHAVNKLSDDEFYTLVDKSLTDNTPYKIVDLKLIANILGSSNGTKFNANLVIFKKDNRLWVKKRDFGHTLKKYGEFSKYPEVNFDFDEFFDDTSNVCFANVFGEHINDGLQALNNFTTDGAVALDTLASTENGKIFLNAISSFTIDDNYFINLHTPNKRETSFFKINGDLELSGRPMIKKGIRFGVNNYNQIVPDYVILTDDFKPDYYLKETDKEFHDKFDVFTIQDGVKFKARSSSTPDNDGNFKKHPFIMDRNTDMREHVYDYVINGDLINDKTDISSELDNKGVDTFDFSVPDAVNIKESSITDDKISSFVFDTNVLLDGTLVKARYLANYRIFRADGEFYISKKIKRLADGDSVPENAVETTIPFVGDVSGDAPVDLDYEKVLYAFDDTLFGQNIPVDEGLTKGVVLGTMNLKQYFMPLYSAMGISYTGDGLFYNLKPVGNTDSTVVHYSDLGDVFADKFILPLSVIDKGYEVNSSGKLDVLSENVNKEILANVNTDEYFEQNSPSVGVLSGIELFYHNNSSLTNLPYILNNLSVVFDDNGKPDYLISDGVYKLKDDDNIQLYVSGKLLLNFSKDTDFMYFLNKLDNNVALVEKIIDFIGRKFKSTVFTKDSLSDYMNSTNATKGVMSDEWKNAGYLNKFDLSGYNAGKSFKAIRFNMYDIVKEMPFGRDTNYDDSYYFYWGNEFYHNNKVHRDYDAGPGYVDELYSDFLSGKISSGTYVLNNHIGTNGISPTDYDTVLFNDGFAKSDYRASVFIEHPHEWGSDSLESYVVKHPGEVPDSKYVNSDGFLREYKDKYLEGQSFFTSKVVSKMPANIKIVETKEADRTKLSFFESGSKMNILPFSGGVLTHNDQTLSYVLEDIVVKKSDNDSVKWASDGASFTYEKDGKTYVKGKRKGLQTGSIVYVKAGDAVYGISIIDLPLKYKDYDGKKVPVYDINNAKFVYKKFPLPAYNYLLDSMDRVKPVSDDNNNRIELKKDTIYAMPKKAFYEMYDSSVSVQGGTTKPDNRLKYIDMFNYEDINKTNTGSNLLSGGYSIDDSDASSWYYELPKSEPSGPIPVYPPENPDLPVPPPEHLFSVGPLRAVLFTQGTPKAIPTPTPGSVKYINVGPINGNGADEIINVIDKSFDSGSGFDLHWESGMMTGCGGYFKMYLNYDESKIDVDDNVYFKLKNNKVRAFIDGNAGNFLFVLPDGDATPEEPKNPETPKSPETPVVIPSVPTESVTPVEPVVTPVTPVSEDKPEPVVTTKPAVASKKVSIKGRIIYKGGVPFENYKVSLGGETIISDKNGDFSFADRDYGSYLLKSDLFKLKLDFSKANKVTDVFVDKNTTVTKVINDKGVFINVVYNLEAPSDEVPVNPGRKVIPKKTPDTLPRTGGCDVSVYGFIMIALALLIIRKKK